MNQHSAQPGHDWNIFARELNYVLQQHGLDLAHQDDRVSVHQLTLRRLVQSLDTPEGLPVLSDEEMQRLIQALQLAEPEILRLRAAMLATAIHRELLLHIQKDDAQLAAEQIFPTIFQSLQKHERYLGNKRDGHFEGLEDPGLDYLLKPAWDKIDSGWILLDQSKHTKRHPRASVEKAHQARDNFQVASDLLKRLPGIIRQKPDSKHAYSEAQKGLASATKRLAEMGE